MRGGGEISISVDINLSILLKRAQVWENQWFYQVFFMDSPWVACSPKFLIENPTSRYEPRYTAAKNILAPWFLANLKLAGVSPVYKNGGRTAKQITDLLACPKFLKGSFIIHWVLINMCLICARERVKNYMH